MRARMTLIGQVTVTLLPETWVHPWLLMSKMSPPVALPHPTWTQNIPWDESTGKNAPSPGSVAETATWLLPQGQ